MNYFERRGGFLGALPVVTRTLLLLNVAVFIITFLLGQFKGFSVNQWLGLHNFMPGFYVSPASNPGSPSTFKPVELVTHMFLHGGLWHIFFNMFGLVMFGRILESVMGSKRFFILYFVSGLGAALLQLGINYYFNSMMAEKIMTFYQAPDPNAFFQLIRDIRYNRFLDQQEQTRIIKLVELWMDNPDRTDLLNNAKYFADLIFKRNITVPMIGASGAIMGILAAFALYFPNVELMLIFLPIPIKAKYFIPIFVVASLFLGVSNIALTSVAHFAHLGGAIFGFIVAKIWKRNRFNIM